MPFFSGVLEEIDESILTVTIRLNIKGVYLVTTWMVLFLRLQHEMLRAPWKGCKCGT